MTSTPTPGRGGDAGSALGRLKKNRGLSKAAGRSVVSEMSASEDEQQASAATPDSVQQAPEVQIQQPVAPVQQAPVQQVAPEPEHFSQSEPQLTMAKSSEDPTPKSKSRRKMSLAPTDDEHDRIRQTFMATRHIHRYASLNDFLRACVLQEVTRLEDEHNGGQVYVWEEAEIPKGRPLRF
ncbi:ParB family protein [Glutamicibacter sp. AOP12-B1-11]|uniref:ParB family protein n=1 Tax=Glutamicibacter sp. AOP12-B1-11 TaxID=3457725 RepID=UPI00403424E4